MPDAPRDPRPDARDAFLDVYRDDLTRDATRPLAKYQSLFPGFENEIAEEWSWLEPDSADAITVGATHVESDTHIGPYRVIRPLGRGAQATVYLGEHGSLRRRVALKVLNEVHVGGSAAHVTRFRREAEVTAQIEHPCICRVFEANLTDDPPWIAMQFVRGKTLAAHLAERPASSTALHLDADPGSADSEFHSPSRERAHLDFLLSIFEQISRTLHVAHEKGLVHRDIKPGNLMIREDGHPVILDFGLAHLIDEAGPGMTRVADILGTSYYLAPEQIRSGDRIDARTDVFAIGVTLYECCTGRRPFTDASREALYHQILHQNPTAPRAIRPQLPRDLEVVLATALAKEPNRRYASALDLADDLRRVRTLHPIRARPISIWGRVTRWTRRNPLLAASAAITTTSLAVGLAISLTSLQRTSKALEERSEVAEALRAQVETAYDAYSRWFAHSDERGVRMPQQDEFDKISLDLLDTERPGLRAKIIAESAHILSAADAEFLIARAQARLLRSAYGEDLDALTRTCLADSLSAKAHRTLRGGRWREADADVIELVALHECAARIRSQEDQPTGPEDLRRWQTNTRFLDALLVAGHADRVLTEVDRFIEELGWNSGWSSRVARRYEVRRARALILKGELDAAEALLENLGLNSPTRAMSARAVTELTEARIEYYDARRNAKQAARARAAFARQLATSSRAGLWSMRTLFAPYPRLWSALVPFADVTTEAHGDLEAILRELRAAMADAGIEIPSPESAVIAPWVRMAADVVSDRVYSDAAVAMCQAAVDMLQPRPDEQPYDSYWIAQATLAEAYRGQDKLADAERILRNTIAARQSAIPHDDYLLELMCKNLGVLLFERGLVERRAENWHEAESLLIRSLRLERSADPNTEHALAHISRIHSLQGRGEQTVPIMHARLASLATWNADPKWLCSAAWAIVRVGDRESELYHDAFTAVQRASESRPATFETQLTLGLAAHRTGQYQLALSALNQCAELREDSSDSSFARVDAVRALVHYARGRFDAAATSLRSARDRTPKSPVTETEHEAHTLVKEAIRVGIGG